MTIAVHAGLLADILEHPEDDVPRLILADWLEDQGCGKQAHFIRVGCTLLARHPVYHAPGCYTPWDCEHSELHPGREPGGDVWVWSRGFVNYVYCPCTDWLAHGPDLVRQQPIQQVRLSDKKPHIIRGEDGDVFIGWWTGENYVEDYALPVCLFGWLSFELPLISSALNVAPYPTEAAAFNALSVACLAWARSQGKRP